MFTRKELEKASNVREKIMKLYPNGLVFNVRRFLEEMDISFQLNPEPDAPLAFHQSDDGGRSVSVPLYIGLPLARSFILARVYEHFVEGSTWGGLMEKADLVPANYHNQRAMTWAFNLHAPSRQLKSFANDPQYEGRLSIASLASMLNLSRDNMVYWVNRLGIMERMTDKAKWEGQDVQS